MGIKECENCEQIIGNLEESFFYKGHVVCKKCKDLLDHEYQPFNRCNNMQETEKDFETPSPFVVGNEHIQEMNPAELPQNFDIEVARKSWASAPNEHIDQAIRNLHDYGFDVQSIIIKEAENRFGKEYVTNMIDSTQPDQCPKSYGGIGRLLYFLGMIGISFLGAMVDVAIREEGVESADIRYILVLVLSFILVVNRLHNIGRKI